MLPAVVSIATTLCFGLAGASLTCSSESQPNPIPTAGGTNPSGTINGTLAVLPIPLSEAQRIVGDKYTIQTAAYRELLPSFPADMYPAIIQAVLDHDIQASGIRIPDFTRISIEYPFISIPGTNRSTSFRLAPIQAISATNPIAIAGSAAYGTHVFPATFDPPCDAYAPSGLDTPTTTTTTTHLNANHVLKDLSPGPLFTTEFTTPGAAGGESPYPLSFFVNVTNQPSFADPAKGCDRQVRLFDTAVTLPPWEPVAVRGDVWASEDVFKGDVVKGDGGSGRKWEGAWGFRLDTAFIEYNLLKCDTL
ncbi:isoflavone reductase family protein [Diplodia corticola]|uniref:Isoflavone reductase family protein n=1 Tax=Diplodia corticola TaxID=236234 RepID=A0A1J9QKY6_9PEZI|nr:isoflavone reductase family protein [Diplodia corticola]OJD29550.1 isoflavone reductase family protein [Diplodia corticola]